MWLCKCKTVPSICLLGAKQPETHTLSSLINYYICLLLVYYFSTHISTYISLDVRPLPTTESDNMPEKKKKKTLPHSVIMIKVPLIVLKYYRVSKCLQCIILIMFFSKMISRFATLRPFVNSYYDLLCIIYLHVLGLNHMHNGIISK